MEIIQNDCKKTGARLMERMHNKYIEIGNKVCVKAIRNTQVIVVDYCTTTVISCQVKPHVLTHTLISI